MKTLINSGSKVNAMHPIYAMKLDLCTRKINVGVYNIDGSHLDTFGIVIADCLVKNKLTRVRFFQETFFLANIGLEVSWGYLFSLLAERTYSL